MQEIRESILGQAGFDSLELPFKPMWNHGRQWIWTPPSTRNQRQDCLAWKFTNVFSKVSHREAAPSPQC